MSLIKKLSLVTIILSFTTIISACSAEIGSEKWCDNMKEMPKGEWTMNDAGDFTKFCILRN
ncbi:MAG: DUF3012 domain-containing protein [Piscirickettsiaceae bacterium]|nr:DUF3012 domain-containing protein [Piscirickettsiaceae bacterium]